MKIKDWGILTLYFNCGCNSPPQKDSGGKRWKEDKEVVVARDFHQGWRVKINLVVKDGWQREAHSTSISALTALFGLDPLPTRGGGGGVKQKINSFQAHFSHLIPTWRISSGQDGGVRCFSDGGKTEHRARCKITDRHLNNISIGSTTSLALPENELTLSLSFLHFSLHPLPSPTAFNFCEVSCILEKPSSSQNWLFKERLTYVPLHCGSHSLS